MLVLPDLEERPELNAFPVLYWNHAGLQMNRITHSLGGPQGGPTMSSRALGLLHLSMHDAFFGILGHDEEASPPTWLANANRPPVPAGLAADHASANAALTGAAMTMLDRLYAAAGDISNEAARTLMSALRELKDGYAGRIDTHFPAYRYGVEIAERIHSALAVLPNEPGADQGATGQQEAFTTSTTSRCIPFAWWTRTPMIQAKEKRLSASITVLSTGRRWNPSLSLIRKAIASRIGQSRIMTPL